MKKRMAVCLILMLCLAGCGLFRNDFEDTMTFYYRRAEYSYHVQEPVIAGEQREVTGHRENTDYLVSMYLMGPLNKELSLPFPAGTKMVQTHLEEGKLTIELTDTGKALTDARFSLACACLSNTFMELEDVSSVTVISGSRSLTTTAEDLLLTDN